jgi:hypothetical protein
MNRTEADARTLLCWRAMGSENPLPQYCCASACMAWEWADTYQPRRRVLCDDPRSTKEPSRPDNVPADWVWSPYLEEWDREAAWYEPEDEWRLRWRGYCGALPK